MRLVEVVAGIQETCGVSQFVMEVSRALVRAGHEVIVVTTMTCGYRTGEVRVALSPDPVAVLDSLPRPDVVHVHNLWSAYGHRAAAWCRARRIPYVISPHGALKPWALRYRWWKKLPALVLYQWRDLRAARAFHVTAESERPGLRRLWLRQPIVVAPLGVWVRGASESCPATLVEKTSSAVWDVVYVGRIHPVKNLDSLLRAWKSLKDCAFRRPVRLVVAGSNDVGHQEELVALALALGLRTVDFSRNLEYGKKQIQGGGEVPVASFRRHLAACEDADVVFTGPVYSEAKDWMYAHARMGVLPSHTENFGGVVVEALAQGTPVIASTGTPWKILEGDAAVGRCGWWTDATPERLATSLKDALRLSEDEYARLSQRAAERARRDFSWESAADGVSWLYESVKQT